MNNMQIGLRLMEIEKDRAALNVERARLDLKEAELVAEETSLRLLKEQIKTRHLPSCRNLSETRTA